MLTLAPAERRSSPRRPTQPLLSGLRSYTGRGGRAPMPYLPSVTHQYYRPLLRRLLRLTEDTAGALRRKRQPLVPDRIQLAFLRKAADTLRGLLLLQKDGLCHEAQALVKGSGARKGVRTLFYSYNFRHLGGISGKSSESPRLEISKFRCAFIAAVLTKRP